MFDFGYNGVNELGQLYRRTSPFAVLDFMTTATELEVCAFCDLFGYYPQYSSIGVFINGNHYQELSIPQAGVSVLPVSLPPGYKRVRFMNGLQSSPGILAGTFITSIRANAPMTAAPFSNNVILAYGDSITVGSDADPITENAWAVQVRRSGEQVGFGLSVEGWGGRQLYNDCVDAPARAAFVEKLQGYNPFTIWLAIGTNDYGIADWDADAFGAAYGALLDDIHAAMPALVVFCQTPLVRYAEDTPNAVGSTLSDYRTAIEAATVGKSFARFVDGTAFMTLSDMSDGLHPNTVGHGLDAAAIMAALAAEFI